MLFGGFPNRHFPVVTLPHGLSNMTGNSLVLSITYS